MKVRLDELAWMTMTRLLLEMMRLPLCPVGEQEIVEWIFLGKLWHESYLKVDLVQIWLEN